LLKCGLADYFSKKAVVKEPTPFPYEFTHRIAADDAQTGLDFGLIPLRDFYRDSLGANGVLPMPVVPWLDQSPPRFDHYALLGLPSEAMVPLARQGDRGPQIGHEVTLTLVGVDALPSPPADRIRSSVPQFAGLLQDGDLLGSVVGMSGGPILGVNSDGAGGWGYSCVAIQGSWDKRDRMIFGTPMGVLVNTVLSCLAATAPP
jgi:hypothetical protein